jgi:hypothetical protein
MYFRYLIFTLLLYCLFPKANAQQVFTVSGTVFKKSSPTRVPQVQVINQRTKDLATADEFGVFHIHTLVGDTLFFKKIDYATQLFVITSTLDINVYLQPIIMLQEVTIKEQTKKQEMDDIMGLYKKQGGYSTLNPTALSVIASPLTGISELFGQNANRARKFQKNSEEELEHIEINKRYNNELIKKVTGLTDEKEVIAFKDAFTPAYVDIKRWSQYDVINYIKTSFDWYQKHKREKLPTLY